MPEPTNADYESLVLHTLRREDMPLKCSEIAHWNGITPGAARRTLLRLESEGKVRQNELGYWEPAPIGSPEGGES
jgi:DNA-binding IclR family transcriptional regulator